MGQALGVAMSDPTLESLTVTGAATIGGDLAVGDDAAVTGDLTVGGAVALNGDVAIGSATSDTLAFYGVTAVAQPAATNQAAPTSTDVVSVSATQWGFSTSTQGNALVDCVIELRSALVTLGLIKGSI